MIAPRRFLAYVALTAVTLLAAVWIYTTQMRMWFMEGGYPIWVAKQTMLRSCQLGDVLIIGDSRPEAGVQPKLLSVPAVNLSFGGATPAETYFVAKQALACPNRPRLVLYSQTMVTFNGFTDGLWMRSIRFGFINLSDLQDIRDTGARLHDNSLNSVDTHDRLGSVFRDVIYRIGFPTVFVPALVRSHFFGRHSANMMLYDNTRAWQGYVVYNGDGALVDDGTPLDFKPSPVQLEYFQKTLDLFEQAGVPVVFVTFPSADKTFSAFHAGAIQAFMNSLTRSTAQRGNFYLLSAEVEFWPDDLFADGLHLNQIGSKILSDRLAACLSPWLAGQRSKCDLSWR